MGDEETETKRGMKTGEHARIKEGMGGKRQGYDIFDAANAQFGGEGERETGLRVFPSKDG